MVGELVPSGAGSQSQPRRTKAFVCFGVAYANLDSGCEEGLICYVPIVHALL